MGYLKPSSNTHTYKHKHTDTYKCKHTHTYTPYTNTDTCIHTHTPYTKICIHHRHTSMTAIVVLPNKEQSTFRKHNHGR